MGLIPNPLNTVLEETLVYHDRRQDVIASNIANANTPGYTAFDLELDVAFGALDGSPGRIVESDAPRRLDGNNVSLETEFAKLTDNRMRYQAIFELMDRWGGLNPIAREIR